ncbi:MAG: stage II sporulation protein P [Ruminococcus sp.]|nr:stage II sporulation protein P [Ruminococcus sp.]
MDRKRNYRAVMFFSTAIAVMPLCAGAVLKKMPEISEKTINITADIPYPDSRTESINSEQSFIGRSALDIEDAPEETETHLPDGEEIPTPMPSEEVLEALPYPADLTDHDGIIEKTNYSGYSGEQYFDLDGGGQVRNLTWHSNADLLDISRTGRVFDIETGTDEPQILIYHTHTTESFELEDKDWYDSDFSGKSTDPDKNITAVGNEICKQLESYGITVLHDTLVHDWPSYDAAYDSSRETVKELLEKYPSVKAAIDIHRDGIETKDHLRPAPVAMTDEGEAAQIMIISGCDDGTMDMPNYLNNFRFACQLQSKAESLYPTFTRPILFDYRFYNQDLTDGSLLIEVGSHGNTLEQAKLSGKLIGKALGELFTE